MKKGVHDSKDKAHVTIAQWSNTYLENRGGCLLKRLVSSILLACCPWRFESTVLELSLTTYATHLLISSGPRHFRAEPRFNTAASKML